MIYGKEVILGNITKIASNALKDTGVENGTLSPAPLNDAVNSEPWHRPKHVGILSCSPFILLRYNGIKCGTEIK